MKYEYTMTEQTQRFNNTGVPLSSRANSLHTSVRFSFLVFGRILLQVVGVRFQPFFDQTPVMTSHMQAGSSIMV